jgi:hypothetical protein
MACIIAHGELRDVYTQGIEIQKLIKKPALNGGFFSLEKPVLNELQSIIKTLTGLSDGFFKSRSFNKRMTTLCLLVKESSHPSSSKILIELEKIDKLAAIYLRDEKQAKVKDIAFYIIILIHKIKPLLESFPMPKKFLAPQRNKKENDFLIEKLWAMAAVLSTPSDHHVKINAFNCRMGLLVASLEQQPECIPWTTLEHLSLMQTLVMKIIKNHENSSCPLTSELVSSSLHSSGKKRKDSPVPKEPIDLLSQFNMQSSSSKSKISSSKDTICTLPQVISPKSQVPPQLPSPKPLRKDPPNPKTLIRSQTGDPALENVFENTKAISSLTGRALPKLAFTEIFDREVGGLY